MFAQKYYNIDYIMLKAYHASEIVELSFRGGVPYGFRWMSFSISLSLFLSSL